MTSLPPPDAPLEQLIAPRPLDDGTFALTFPDGWQQGRGAFGGLVIAALVRTVEVAVGDGRPVRSITAALCGPVQPGAATVRIETLRAGSGVTTVAARLLQDGEIQAHAVIVQGKTRATDCDAVHLTPPVQPDWHALPVLPIGPPLGPDFARYFEFRNSGHLPFSGKQADQTSGWVRPLHANVRDAAWIAACADAWWPVLFTQVPAPRPMATIAFTLQWLCDPATLDAEAPLQHVARTKAIADGYAIEFRELWSHDGRLVALNEQTMAVIK